MVLGFDFDKVFVDYPPFIPYSVIDFLYKGTSVFKRKNTKKVTIHYRIPGEIEKKVRIISHFPAFRAPIKKNIAALKKISNLKAGQIYLVSSRFSFLKKRTDVVLDKYKLNNYFDGIYFNYKNKQPHIFKEETIRKLKIDTYVDDDLDLALYLSSKIPSLKIFWITEEKANNLNLPPNIIPINSLNSLIKHIKK